MEGKDYSFEFFRFNFNTDKFNRRHALIIKNLVSNSRLKDELVFNSFGLITYNDEDKQHRYPNIEILGSEFNKKTNCIIFDLKESVKNNNYYNKLFLYHSSGPNIGNYGYVLYNTETGKYVHKYFIDYEYESLMCSINQSLNLLSNLEIYDFYKEKYNTLKIKNYISSIDITNKGYNDMINRRHERIKAFYK